MTEPSTVATLLAEASRDLDADDARWLLAHALGRDRSWLYAHADDEVDASAARVLQALCARRKAGEPVAYLTGRQGFWTLELAVSPATLVPRPETELLVELALQRISVDAPCRLADLGTGSGAIALALARERPLARVVATDASVEALAIAHQNAKTHRIYNIEFRHGDWLAPLAGERFDLIASNPPYIALGDPHLAQGDLRFEPPLALASGADGLDAIRAIVAGAPSHLVPGGWLLLEHGWEQGSAVRALLDAAGFSHVASVHDLESRERISLGRRGQAVSRANITSPHAAGTSMRTLYPELSPYQTGTLAVDERHTLYWEQCGNPEGKPVVLLHGGPGAGCNEKMRRFHDPSKYRIVLFDQRGAGRSTPHADLVDNTTWDLVADIEKLRELLGIQRWQVFGGSWGSTLALAYAETHPQRVTELVLRGIFMLRRWELQWFYQEGASRLFPEAWEHYLSAIHADERNDLIAAYNRRLTSGDEATRLAAAKAWSIWEGGTSYLHIDPDYTTTHGDPRFALAFARIENHYFVNQGFFEHDDQLLRDVHRIQDIPGVIVHGRYDVVCPVQSAFDLHKAWPKAALRISAASGHSGFEAENIAALVEATDRFAA